MFFAISGKTFTNLVLKFPGGRPAWCGQQVCGAGDAQSNNAAPEPTKQRWADGFAGVKHSDRRVLDTWSVSLEGNALLAVARLERASEGFQESPWALGPQRGTKELVRDLDFCGNGSAAEHWVDHTVRSVVLRSAAGSLASAKRALRGWTAFAD